MKKFQIFFSGFFALLSTLNMAGILKGGALYEPIPPHLREENNEITAK